MADDFFSRPEAAQREWAARTGSLRTVFALDRGDGKAGPAVGRALLAVRPAAALPQWLRAMAEGGGGAVASARQLRRGAVPGLVGRLPPAVPDPRSVLRPAGHAAIRFVFAVSGPLYDQEAGPDFVSSWAAADKSFVHRRDALARCVVAALWHRAPAGDPAATGADASAIVYSDRTVALLYPQPPHAVVELTADFARCVGARTAPHESRVLQLLDNAVRARRSVSGAVVHPRHPSLAAAAAAAVGGDAGPGYVLELHDSLAAGLPVFSKKVRRAAAAGVPPTGGAMQVVVTLGVVEDHLKTVEAVLAAGRGRGLAQVRVNLGPVAEFSSKVVALLQAHSDGGVLLPALRRAAKGKAGAAAPDLEGGADLHFWVWRPDLRARCIGRAKRGEAMRPQTWLLPNAALAAVAKSHGAYCRREGLPAVRLSFVLRDCVLTVDAALVHQHVGGQGWGALTEHHLLAAMQRALDTGGGAGEDFATAWRRIGAHAVLAITHDAPDALPLYDAKPVPPHEHSAQPLCVLLEPPPLALEVARATASSVLEARVPAGLTRGCTVRTIVTLQAINNYGRLLALVWHDDPLPSKRQRLLP